MTSAIPGNIGIDRQRLRQHPRARSRRDFTQAAQHLVGRFIPCCELIVRQALYPAGIPSVMKPSDRGEQHSVIAIHLDHGNRAREPRPMHKHPRQIARGINLASAFAGLDHSNDALAAFIRGWRRPPYLAIERRQIVGSIFVAGRYPLTE
jgi:hypothetical protein